AAAELGRNSTTGGFALLADLPVELAQTDATGSTLLRRLFQPQPETAKVFDLIWYLRTVKGPQKLRGAIGKLENSGSTSKKIVIASVVAWLVAATLGVVTFVVAGPGSLIVTIPLLIIVKVGAYIAWRAGRVYDGATSMARTAPALIADNFHGICNGSSTPNGDVPALTDWLHTKLQALAGRNDPTLTAEQCASVVTYGELRAAGVELTTITTDLTHGTSERFPLQTGGWAFNRDEMARLFPADVVAHLVANGITPTDAARAAALTAAGLHPLPEPDQLPILLGARISLSFPLLLSAVPLYAWTPEASGGRWSMTYVKSWFSDGGITSNLPVHLFDRPLPTRPTYAINLGGGAIEGGTPCENVWRPITARQGAQPASGTIDSTLRFMSAVFDTMQNWADNSLSRAPGQRDRICTVRLGAGEGGMNLDMDAATIARIAAKGAAAGENLAWIRRGSAGSTGCPPPATIPADALGHQWDRHRFTRYRTFLAGLGGTLVSAEAGASFDASPLESYSQLAASAVDTPWLPYRSGWNESRRTKVDAALRTMWDLDARIFTADPPAGSTPGDDN
ncbi:MAG: hypothetical protein RLZZ623_1319, partial [Actinomycetota bacterium]